MKRPPASVMFFGHPLVVAAVGCFALWLGYLWWTGAAEGVGALVALLAATGCARAGERAGKYRQWQREWNAMSGTPRGGVSLGGLRKVAAIVGGLLAGLLALSYLSHPTLSWAAILTLLGLGIAVLRAMTGGAKTKASAKRAASTPSVAQCLRPPGQSTHLNQAYAALPDYCRRMLRTP
ncbi:hypothetical protein OMP43_17755 [Sphingomonas sp. CBMAI 2297]|uniref:hypothetical protein n=1 Tax=Sphingomonas sp. CBMAI 2297 TaxID=2991720 RepID=UPI002456A04A|nr:hypothetical protein [Sphingomonas sp. CBMAI 2297]MDH4745874.1 hypothetical protein [Sphingomonas sp. CBMAI 2297]